MRSRQGATTRSEQTEPPYDELAPDTWLADVFRGEMTRLGREPLAREIEAAVPLGSTDMGNVTQLMPGIHPVVGVEAEGASVHQPGFAKAAAGPSGDKAVYEARDHAGAHSRRPCRIALRARPGARAPRQAGGVMTLAAAADDWLAAHYDDLVAWRRHMHTHPELGRQEFATTQFVASRLADAGLNPKVLPGGTGLICDFGPEHGPRIALRADMDALPMADRTGTPYAFVVPNVSHACGHDAHTAMLLGTALALNRCPSCRSACG